jgi:hypothetical protein
MARSGAVLLVVFQVTNIALSSEDAGFVADRSQQFAAEEWTDGALGRLEPRSAILVRSPAMAFRLWAARLVRGERPDIVVIPLSLLDRGQVATTLLASERELEPLLRDIALSGQPSEFSLSELADVRPLHIELDRGWSNRLLSHLVVDGFWLEFAPQPLGPSDRKASTTLGTTPLRRVLDAIAAPTVPDASTSSIVAEALRSHSMLLSQLGEHDAARAYLGTVSRMASSDPFTISLSLKHAIATTARAAANQGRMRASKTGSGAGRDR